MNFDSLAAGWLWSNALGAIPLAIAAALIGRFVPCRASTRHAMWLLVLLWLLMPPVLPSANLAGKLNDWLASNRSGDSPASSTEALPKPPSPAKQPEPSLIVPRSAQPAPTLIGWHPSQVQVDAAAAPPSVSGLDQSVSAQWLADVPRPLMSELMASTSPPIEPVISAIEPPISLPAASATGAASEHRVSEIAGEWSQWFAQFAGVRDALVALTPIPTSLWVMGSLLIVIVGLTRIIRFRRQLKAAEAAPPEVMQAVRRAANKIGLSTIPQTILLRRRIAPSVWCGGRRKLLILPEQLWNELDEPGRDAVLLHELAHLKRRDHWVCWAELLASCVYWWHPLLWWIRKRLRDEADFCCDAWVTALLPADRRAYARALLITRQFADEARLAVPAVGLGATTIRAKRFARRLTMVMTQSNKPRLSASGTILAVCLAAGAWLASPLWACPPEESAARAKQEAKAAKEREAVDKAKAKAPKVVAAPRAPGVDASTFERHMAERERQGAVAGAQPRTGQAPRGMAPGHGGDLEARINELEHRLNRISEQLEQLLGERRGGGGAVVAPRMRTQPPTARPAQPAPGAPPAPPAPSVAPAPRGFGQAQGQAEGGVIIRLYRLPKGKLQPLVELMSRSDVPVLIAGKDDGIEVHGTPHQHEIFGAFVALIDPDGREHAAMGIGPAIRGGLTEAMRAYELAAAAQAGQHRAQLTQEMLKAYSRQREQIHRQQHDAHQQSEAMRKAAEEMYRRAAELESKAEQLQEQAEEAEGNSKHELLHQAEVMMAEARTLEAQADAQHDHAEAMLEHLEAALEQIEDAFASVEDLADLEDLEDLEEALHEEIEAEEVEAVEDGG